MDPTTKMIVSEIQKNGYYRQGQTLGAGGWGECWRAMTWDKYTLFVNLDKTEWIKAKSDDIAIEAFHSLYHLNGNEWEITKTVSTSTVIAKSM